MPIKDNAEVQTDCVPMIRALQSLERGQKLVYHTGFIACESSTGVKLIADEAYKLYREGRVRLTQRRVTKTSPWSLGQFDYIATGA